jgi:RNA polymerase-binding transcription factor DksA
MPENKQTKEQLIKRRDEINAQMNRVNHDLQTELDRDPEEQAIEVEQNEVPITMEDNLRKELIQIEDRLAQMEEE